MVSGPSSAKLFSPWPKLVVTPLIKTPNSNCFIRKTSIEKSPTRNYFVCAFVRRIYRTDSFPQWNERIVCLFVCVRFRQNVTMETMSCHAVDPIHTSATTADCARLHKLCSSPITTKYRNPLPATLVAFANSRIHSCL